MKQIRHTGDIRGGYRGLMEDSVMAEEKKDCPAVALVLVDSDTREAGIKKVLLENFSRVRVSRTAEEGIWMARRISAGGERVEFILCDASVSTKGSWAFSPFVGAGGTFPASRFW